jgi:hypothetical protein
MDNNNCAPMNQIFFDSFRKYKEGFQHAISPTIIADEQVQ